MCCETAFQKGYPKKQCVLCHLHGNLPLLDISKFNNLIGQNSI